MAQNIFNLANDISLNRQTNKRRSNSVSGYSSTVRAGPTFYEFDVTLPLLTKQQSLLIESDLDDMQDGLKSVTNIRIPSSTEILDFDGTLTASGTISIETINVPTPENKLQIITINGVTSDSTIKAGNYIQFTADLNPLTRPDYKVYQIKSDSTIFGNSITFEINQPVLTNIINRPFILFANACSFKLSLFERPNMNIIPGPKFNYYQYDTFKFKEVL